MRHIDKIIIHCLETKPSQDVDISDVRRWHIEENGWSDVGYHFLIKYNGAIQHGRDLDVAGAHARGFNSNSIGIALQGGLTESGDKWDVCSVSQEHALVQLIMSLRKVLPGDITVHPHSEFSITKTCPNFDISKLGL